MKRFIALLVFVSVMTLGLSTTSSAEDTAKVAEKKFLVKGNLGWNMYPGLMGYMLYMEVPDALGYTSGLSLNADFLYFINPWLSVGLNAACLPFFQFKDIGSVSVNCELIPVVAEVQVYPAKIFYLNLGLGLGFVHGSGSTTSGSIYFVDMVAGENVGQSFNVFRGPYFIVSYGLGFQIDLTGQDTFGIDIFMKFYDIFGHPGIDELAKTAETYAKVPGFLLQFMMNTGVGVYFRF